MANTKKAVLTALLPATPCTPEMRQETERIAKERNVSLAEIQRKALYLFLRRIDSETINNESPTSECQLETIGAN